MVTAYDNKNQECITKFFKHINHIPDNSRNTLIFGQRRFAHHIQASETVGYSELKNAFHTNPDSSALCALPNTVGILLCLDGVINSTYPWLQNHSLDHVI